MNRILLASLVAAVATACASSPYKEPYAEIRVDDIRPADPNVIPVIINRVDDKTTLDSRYAVVAPGVHKVTVDVPPRKGFHLGTQADFVITTEPCMRYYIDARLETRVTQEWTPFVRSVEPIGECREKFAAR
jgi:hypothetical protein